MSPSTQQSATLDTILGRLLARHHAVQRQLEAVVRRAGLAPDVVARVARTGAAEPTPRLAEVRARIEAEAPALPGLSYEELTRPSLEEITRPHLRPLRV